MGKDVGLANGVTGAVLVGLKIVGVIPLSVVYILDSFVRSVIPRRFKRRAVDGEVVVITGGSSGLGRELAVRFAKAGAHVIVWGRNEKNLDETCRRARDVGGHCTPYRVDVTDRDAVYCAAQQILKDFRQVDILINNAGVVTAGNILDKKDDDICNTFNVNVISHFFTTKAFLGPMLHRNSGHVVTVSSMAGYCAVNMMTDYCSSKYAAVGFNEALTMELRVNGNSGMSTTLVCPYYIDTGMFSGVKSRFVPVMSTEYVADETFDAILMRKRFLFLPGYSPIGIFLSTFLPDKLQFLCYRILGITDCLTEYQGRPKIELFSNGN